MYGSGAALGTVGDIRSRGDAMNDGYSSAVRGGGAVPTVDPRLVDRLSPRAVAGTTTAFTGALDAARAEPAAPAASPWTAYS